ncbi:hypothetical protein BU204_23640 [Actinophytocola xanthii]|uniref:Uncharacterized protein n=2 Tax=Actinophytocola xanthii TaxID=1912961 RepID=A0A1Q8CL30_9PSEU|nr:hypothetical protein BU204_23640 [Actinophytocola xanthii]
MRSIPHQNEPRLDVIVFLAVLACGLLLVCLGVPVGSLATASIAMSGLYGSWSSGARRAAEGRAGDLGHGFPSRDESGGVRRS